MLPQSFHYSVFVIVYDIIGVGNNLPLKWNKNTKRLAENFCTDRKALVRKCRFLYLFMTCVLLQIAVWLFSNERKTILEKIQVGIAFIAFTTASAHASTVFDKISEIILCTMGFFRFLEIHKDKRSYGLMETSLIRRLNLLLACGVCFAATFFPFLQIYALHWFKPCLPSLAGYLIIPSCQGFAASCWEIPIKLAVLIVNHIMLHVSCQWIAYVIAVFLSLGTISLIDCLKIFWLSLRDEMEIGRIGSCGDYRQLQLLDNLNNAIQQKVMTPSILIMNIVFHAICLSASVFIIKDYHIGGSFAALAYFGMMTIDLFLMLLVLYGGMSCVYKESKHLLLNVKSSQGQAVREGKSKKIRMWQSKFFKSCTILKVRFGGNNFVDALTPLNSLNVSLGLVVQLLLLKQ